MCVRIFKKWLILLFFLIRLNNLLSGELMSKDLIKVANKLESIGLYEEASIIRSAMYLGEGYLTCDKCGTRYAEGRGGSMSGRGMDICKVCSGDISPEDFQKHRSGAHESFKKRKYNLD